MDIKQYDATAYSQKGGFKSARIYLDKKPKGRIVSLGEHIKRVEYYFSNERNTFRLITQTEASKIVYFMLNHFPPIEVDRCDQYNTIIRPEHTLWHKSHVIQQCPQCMSFMPIWSPFILLKCGECRAQQTIQQVKAQKACGIEPLTTINWEDDARIVTF